MDFELVTGCLIAGCEESNGNTENVLYETTGPKKLYQITTDDEHFLVFQPLVDLFTIFSFSFFRRAINRRAQSDGF